MARQGAARQWDLCLIIYSTALGLHMAECGRKPVSCLSRGFTTVPPFMNSCLQSSAVVWEPPGLKPSPKPSQHLCTVKGVRLSTTGHYCHGILF